MANEVSTAVKIGAILFVVWGILHLWVGYEGLHGYSEGTKTQWEMVIGGDNMPIGAFQHATDPRVSETADELSFCLIILIDP